MTNWREVKLGELISIKHGYAFKGNDITTEDNGIVLVTPGNFAIGGGFQEEKCKFFKGQYPKDYVLKENDLIVTMTDLSKECDTLGYSALVPSGSRIYLHNQRIGLVEFKNNLVDKLFLYWFMRTKKYQHFVVSSCSGSVIKHTSPGRICDATISLPPLDVQKKIAGVLGALDDKIELNNKINNNLEQQAQALFKSWFVDFEPFGGKMPDDWKIGKLEDVVDVIMGQSPSGNSYNEKGRGCIFFQGRAEFGFRFPTIKLFTTEPRRMARQNDILMSVRAPVGDVNVAHEDCCIGRGLCAIRSKDNFQSFILYTLWSVQNKLNIFNGEGTVFGSINKDSLNNLEIIVPNSNTIQKFENLCSPMDNLIRKNYEENTRLSALRDTLLPKLMSGEIDVSKVDINKFNAADKLL